jgi:hypothetical protein
LGLLNFLLEATRKGLWHETQISHLCLKQTLEQLVNKSILVRVCIMASSMFLFLGVHSMSIFFTLLLSKYLISKYLNHLKFNLNWFLHWILAPYICLNFHY